MLINYLRNVEFEVQVSAVVTRHKEQHEQQKLQGITQELQKLQGTTQELQIQITCLTMLFIHPIIDVCGYNSKIKGCL